MKKSFRIMLVMGLIVLCAAGYFAYLTYQFQSEAIYAEGQITDLRYSRDNNSSSPVWYPEVTFVDDTGKKNVFKSSVGSSSYRNSLGNVVDVIYRPGDAGNARINSYTELYLGSIIFGGIALACLFISVIGLLLTNSGNRHKRLIHEGKPLIATIVNVELNDAININGRSPWRIVCQWFDPQSGKVFLFNSANLYYDPSPYIKDKNITVYVARDNLKKYHVDISHLPKKA